MAQISRVQQLTNTGILDANKSLDQKVVDVIDTLTDNEFYAILTVRAKIDPANRTTYDGVIQKAGF
jgi:hypothetical protein